jgi:5-methylcytosine-specific restriction endonuclease McrA
MIKNFYQSPQWLAIRKMALERDNYRCVICSEDVSGFKKSRVDHIIPRKDIARNGKALELTLSNLRTLCVPCDLKFDAARGVKNPKAIVRIGADGLPADGSWA